MEIQILENSVTLKNFRNFGLGQTFDCGQCFRFKQISENKFQTIAYKKVLNIIQNESEIIFENTSKNDFENIWKNYFDLETDYAKIWGTLSKISPVLSAAYEFAPGIRILRQEHWETLCSYIISQNNNIPRIKKIIAKLCELFGEKIEGSENEFDFPSAEKIASLSLEDLAPIKSGFRAKYILDAAKKVALKEVNLGIINDLPFDKAMETLMKINGVGPKVASCVLLYGFHRLEAFPMDVWMKKVMNTFFEGKSSEIFGEYAGIAQQYLYNYSRAKANELFN